MTESAGGTVRMRLPIEPRVRAASVWAALQGYLGFAGTPASATRPSEVEARAGVALQPG